MFTEYQKNVKFKNKVLSSGIKALDNKRKNKSQINLFPHIKKSTSLYTRLKNTTLSGSINILYKAFFPGEKNSVDNFLDNLYNKKIRKPKWNYSIKKTRNDDKIRNDLIKKNRVMRSYEYLRKPTILIKRPIKKPNMVQIVENNFSYKYRFFLNPWEEEYNLFLMKRYKQEKDKLGIKDEQILLKF